MQSSDPSKRCPKCGLLNAGTVVQCKCGYDLLAGDGRGAGRAGMLGFQPTENLSTWVVTFLSVDMLLALVSLWSDWQHIDLLKRMQSGIGYTEQEFVENQSRQAVVGVIFFVNYLITSILFLRWVFLSNRNAHALGAENMKFTPGWSVGWFFVPIFHFWKPYAAMRELFKTSDPDYSGRWEEAPGPAWLPLWWLCWLASTGLGQASMRVSVGATETEELLTGAWLSLASDLVELPLAFLAIWIVKRLTELQMDKLSRMPVV